MFPKILLSVNIFNKIDSYEHALQHQHISLTIYNIHTSLYKQNRVHVYFISS